MGRGKRISPFEKCKIARLRGCGMSIPKISNNLRRSPKVVKNFIDLEENYGRNNHGNRKYKLSPRYRSRIVKEASNKIYPVNKLLRNYNSL